MYLNCTQSDGVNFSEKCYCNGMIFDAKERLKCSQSPIKRLRSQRGVARKVARPFIVEGICYFNKIM